MVLAGTISAEPVQRRLPSGDEVTELRVSVPEAGRRLLPLPVAAWHATVGPDVLRDLAKGDQVLVHGSWCGGSTAAAPGRGASPRWWPPASRSWRPSRPRSTRPERVRRRIERHHDHAGARLWPK